MLMRFIGKRVPLLLPLLVLASPARGQEETIVDVKVEGNRKIEKGVILNALRSRAGDPLSPEKVDADIRAVHRLGYFRDVWVSSDKVAGGVNLVVHVSEMPVVREIKIEGNKEISADKIREKVDVKANTLLNPKDLTQSARKIRKMYTDEGYYLAEVKGDVEKISDTEVKGVFTITEGKKILISRIRFEGNQAYTERKLKKTMETSEEWFLSWITGAGTYKEDVLKNDVALLADLYLNNGYINIKVGEPRVELLSDKSGLEVTIPISEGEQFRVGTIGFKGELLDTPDELRAKMKVKPGELFNRGTIRNDIIALTDLYADRGYAFANVAPLTKVDAAARTVDLTFDVEKGEKVTIERINIGGNLRTRDKVVRRELKLAEGDLYSSTAIKRSKQSLMNLGFFEDVNLATAPASKSDRLNLNVDVKEKATGTFSIGAGFSSLDGLIGQGSVQQANFLGLGLKANASVSLGGKSQ
ncbi:MAG TPA: outer membrane protein assembly factor BamA, partial [Verrucomicrobiae bacterium]|nr:outer membrane protein assembly factor BamA [Verrucomicrobiae bacterium]